MAKPFSRTLNLLFQIPYVIAILRTFEFYEAICPYISSIIVGSFNEMQKNHNVCTDVLHTV